MLELNLQMFSEMPAADTGSGAGDVTGQAAPEAAAAQPEQQQQSQPTFNDLIQGQYRQEYENAVGQRIQSAIQQRFRNQQDLRQQLAAAQPIVAAAAQKFGLRPDDVAGITAKLNEDAYAEEANRRGVPVDVVRHEHQQQAIIDQLQAKQQQAEEAQALRNHLAGLGQQAQEFAKELPGFDLVRELQTNPDFARYTSPQFGMSVKAAYYACHGPQMQQQGMQYAANQARQSIAQSVAAGAARPAENGMGRAGAANMRVDVRNMTQEQRNAIRQQLRNGLSVAL